MAQNNMADMLQSLLSGLNADSAGEQSSERSSEQSNRSSTEETSRSQESSGFDFGSLFDNIDIDMVMKIGELFSRFNQPDKNAELLRALRPIMREENREKIDTAIKLLKITALLPYLRESGFMDKIF